MRAYVLRLLDSARRRLTPKPPPTDPRLLIASQELAESRERESMARGRFMEFISEIGEASRMAGAGPWKQSEQSIRESDRLLKIAESVTHGRPIEIEEAQLPGAVGAFGDIELALQNVDWRREINFSWLEFTRWGIQQIMLISRLYYIKNPIVRRLVDVCAAYVFARGVEVTTNDEAANDVLKDFFAKNSLVFGHVGLMRQERAKDLDGNIFWVFFSDTAAAGDVNVRTIDPIEIEEIICDSNDADTEQLYKRCWVEQVFDASTGAITTASRMKWYPALNYVPKAKPTTIGGVEVDWKRPIYHRKCGEVGKWRFGCPRIYALLDWAKEGRRYLEACASLAQSLAHIGLTITTKGGQQALEAMKQQLQTTVGPSAQLWDQNPPPITASVFGSGPGTKLEAFKTQGAGLDPEKVRQFKLMCCMVKGVPETFLGDVSTGNLATATSLDRPTETVFLNLQEEWREDLIVIATYVLSVNSRATSGKLQESLRKANYDGTLKVVECSRRTTASGRTVYEAFSKTKTAGTIEVKVNFPNIREGDVPALVDATVKSMTLGSKTGGAGQGIDQKVGIISLYDLLGIEGGDEIAEKMYPDYDPKRDAEEPTEIVPAPVGGPPAAAAPAAATAAQESMTMKAAARRLLKAMKLLEVAANDEGGQQ